MKHSLKLFIAIGDAYYTKHFIEAMIQFNKNHNKTNKQVQLVKETSKDQIEKLDSKT